MEDSADTESDFTERYATIDFERSQSGGSQHASSLKITWFLGEGEGVLKNAECHG